MKIIDLIADNPNLIEQAANLLVIGFREHWPTAWPDMDSALEEVHDMLAPDRICRAAVDGDGTLLGWVGGQDFGYDGHVWELHPLVVHPDHQGNGIGRVLMEDLENLLRQRGVLTLTLGTDDEDFMTSLAGVDLYEDVWQKIQHIHNLKQHPYSFYQKLGFTITGVLPDANGPGRPDIYMSKRLQPPPSAPNP